jgi:hypothetical protein
MGGIPHAEYTIHVLANGLHAVGVALALASLPAAAWSADTGLQASSLSVAARWLAAALLVAACVTSAQHVALLRRPIPTEAGIDLAIG